MVMLEYPLDVKVIFSAALFFLVSSGQAATLTFFNAETTLILDQQT